MRRNKQKLLLTIETTSNRPLGQAEMQIIKNALNQRFKDASFEIDHLPENHIDWQPTLLCPSLQAVFQQLIKTNGWTSLPNKRVHIHRLKSELPEYFKIVAKRKSGYKLIDLRRAA